MMLPSNIGTDSLGNLTPLPLEDGETAPSHF